MPVRDRPVVYYTALLRYLGCTADAHMMSAVVGDEIAARAAFATIDPASPRDQLRWLARHAAGAVTFAGAVTGSPREVYATACEVGRRLAARLGLADDVQHALLQAFERWDGKGFPAGPGGRPHRRRLADRRDRARRRGVPARRRRPRGGRRRRRARRCRVRPGARASVLRVRAGPAGGAGLRLGGRAGGRARPAPRADRARRHLPRDRRLRRPQDAVDDRPLDRRRRAGRGGRMAARPRPRGDHHPAAGGAGARPRPRRRAELDLGATRPARRRRARARAAAPVPDRARARARAGAGAAGRDRRPAPRAARRLRLPPRLPRRLAADHARAYSPQPTSTTPSPSRGRTGRRARPSTRRTRSSARSRPGSSTPAPPRRCSTRPGSASTSTARGRRA